MKNFISNTGAETLKKRLIELISKSQELKFLVGFFYFSGIRELYEGGAPMSSQIARKVVAAFQKQSDNSNEHKNLDILTAREKEILEFLSRGLMYKDIAAQLFLSPETVRKHVYHIYEKLHVNNRVSAVNKFYGR